MFASASFDVELVDQPVIFEIGRDRLLMPFSFRA